MAVSGYEMYCRYKAVLDVLEKQDATAYEIIKLTGIHQTVAYRIINELKKRDIIVKVSYQLYNKRKVKVYRLNPINNIISTPKHESDISVSA